MEILSEICEQEFDGSSIECSHCEASWQPSVSEGYAATLDTKSGYLDSGTAKFSTFCDQCDRDLEDVSFELSVQQN